MENKYHIGYKHCEKRRNCLLQAISPFLTLFSTAFWSIVRQNAVLCGNGLTNYLGFFNDHEKETLLKTLCEKEKILKIL